MTDDYTKEEKAFRAWLNPGGKDYTPAYTAWCAQVRAEWLAAKAERERTVADGKADSR